MLYFNKQKHTFTKDKHHEDDVAVYSSKDETFTEIWETREHDIHEFSYNTSELIKAGIYIDKYRFDYFHKLGIKPYKLKIVYMNKSSYDLLQETDV